MVLHGDGSPTRRYLYAGDAADAFDTILHKGEVGQVYNVGSYDEISNMSLCGHLLTEMGIPHDAPADFDRWVKHTRDRPFNDHRYAVDGTKLRQLGWEQKTSFANGLRTTVDWYKRFGEAWWGELTKVLCPFPLVDKADSDSGSVDGRRQGQSQDTERQGQRGHGHAPPPPRKDTWQASKPKALLADETETVAVN